MKIALICLVLFLPNFLFAGNNISAPSVLPDGYDNIYIGMPLQDFLKVRKKVKSGTGRFELMMEYWWRDPNNPKKIDWSKDVHSFRESSCNSLFNGETEYTFDFNHELHTFNLVGRVSQLFPQKIKNMSYAVIQYAFNKWGVPDESLVLEYENNRDGIVNVLLLDYEQSGAYILVWVPIRYRTDCSCKWIKCVDWYFCRLWEKAEREAFFTIHIKTNKYGVVPHRWGRGVKILPKTERDTVLKETGYFEILKQVEDKQ